MDDEFDFLHQQFNSKLSHDEEPLLTQEEINQSFGDPVEEDEMLTLAEQHQPTGYGKDADLRVTIPDDFSFGVPEDTLPTFEDFHDIPEDDKLNTNQNQLQKNIPKISPDYRNNGNTVESSEDEREELSNPKKRKKKKKKKQNMLWLDAAFRVLTENGEPMTKFEIADETYKKKYRGNRPKTPHITIATRINENILNHGDESRFVQTGLTSFGLRSFYLNEDGEFDNNLIPKFKKRKRRREKIEKKKKKKKKKKRRKRKRESKDAEIQELDTTEDTCDSEMSKEEQRVMPRKKIKTYNEYIESMNKYSMIESTNPDERSTEEINFMEKTKKHHRYIDHQIELLRQYNSLREK